MELIFKLPEKVWCITPQTRAENVFVLSGHFEDYNSTFNKKVNFMNHFIFTVDIYDPKSNNSCRFTVKANRCFNTKQQLLNSL